MANTEDNMRLSFFGAAGEVTGSCFLFEAAGRRILIDCGMFQGSVVADARNHEAFPFDPKTVDAVLVTHAHLDHTGRIPKLVRDGFHGRIFSTKPTADLARIIGEDALEVMDYESEKQGTTPIFDEKDLRTAMRQYTGMDYQTPFAVADGVVATWHDAGHILGSSFISVEVEGKRIVFSGDLGNPGVPILQPTEPLGAADTLVLESTYGGHLHEESKLRVDLLRAAIIKTVNARGVLLIPAFAVERIQEILYELNGLAENGKIPRVPIFLDSPLAIKATAIFKKYPTFYNAAALKLISSGDDFFDFPGLTMTPTRDESRAINDTPQPKVIIAGAGMMSGGRILHHARRYLQDNHSTVLIVGYQSGGTLGRALLDGAREVIIYGDRLPVRARIQKIGAYSAHADRGRLAAWVAEAASRPSRIFLVHGEPDSRAALAHALHDKVGIDAQLPEQGNVFNL